jgi:uncharacterized surface protein with fasciclin (FAS1) repeats
VYFQPTVEISTMTFKTIRSTLAASLLIISAGLFSAHSFAAHHGDKEAKKDIVDTAVAAGSFNTLATALTEAGLIETLKGEGPFTVFAPTDDAFAKLPADQLKAILADKELLTSILTYHVVAGKVMAADVVKLESATSLQGSQLAISTTDGVKINDANVTETDIKTSNGVIHIIDTVLVPAQ